MTILSPYTKCVQSNIKNMIIKYSDNVQYIKDNLQGINQGIKDNFQGSVRQGIKDGKIIIINFSNDYNYMLSEGDEYKLIINIMNSTGCRYFEWDIDCSIPKKKHYQRYNVLKRILRDEPNLYISYSIPTDAPSEWGLGGISDGIMKILLDTVKENIKISIINLKLMNYYIELELGRTLADIICEIIENVVIQLKKIFPTININTLLGLTFLINKHTDNNVFTINDAKIIKEFIKNKEIGMISYYNYEENIEFYDIFKIEQEILPKLNNLQMDVPLKSNSGVWKEQVFYHNGDIIEYDNIKYKCINSHMSINDWAPSIYTQSLWEEINKISVQSNIINNINDIIEIEIHII